MSAEVSLYSLLSTATTVTALVAARVYPDVAPQESALPAIVFERTGTEYLNTIHGTTVGTRVTLEVWCMAEGRTGAEGLADAVLQTVAGTAFVPVGRRADFDAEQQLWAAIVALDLWE